MNKESKSNEPIFANIWDGYPPYYHNVRHPLSFYGADEIVLGAGHRSSVFEYSWLEVSPLKICRVKLNLNQMLMQH